MSSPIPNPQSPIPDRKPWRIAFIVYAIALTTATHWPRLTFGPDTPVTDKEIHIAAFALLMLLLWLTRWCGSLLMTAIVSIAWGGIDEWTQAIPVLHRSASWLDVAANTAGIVGMTIVIAILNRWRNRQSPQ